MNKKRPVNLDLSTLKFPVMAIASILHRISGIMLFLLMPLMLYFLKLSLAGEQSFADLQITLSSPFLKLALLVFCASLIYHALAGFRHLFMDMGFGEHLAAARATSVFVIVSSVILTIFLGIWIW